RHDNKEAPPDDRPHYDSVVMLVENGYQPEIPESKIRDSDGQAAVILVRTMSLILVALVLLLAGGLGWGALHLKRRLERSERDRLELVRSSSGEPTRLLGDVAVDSAAAVSLRAHGVVVGTLVIADPRDRTFPPEDMRLLSTVATHAAIVIANARFFQMVQHAKEQWETAFDALSEGIAVVDDQGCISRANRALAAMLGAPIPGVIGCDLGEALLGPSHALHELLVAAREGN